MTVRNLEFLFRPKSVAVVAEPETPNPYAEVVLRNLAGGGFAGPVTCLSAKRRSLFGMGARAHIEELEATPDLAIVCAARRDVPQIIARLGERGTRAVIVGASTREKLSGSELMELRKAILDAARPHLMRVLGPGSGGLLVPASGLNASVAPVSATRGKVALIAQSTAVASAVLDRACSKGIGFSTVLHLGASIDVDLADVLDWLAADPETEAILVQFDAVAVGRKFMSAARAAARNKPVVAIRRRRAGTEWRADRLFDDDEVYEAALRRAGWVRIDTLEDLFDAAEAMARVRPTFGQRLSIVANGHGLGRIAADALLRSGGRLATLSKDTVTQLDALLQTGAPPCNPVALPADVTPANWAAALARAARRPRYGCGADDLFAVAVRAGRRRRHGGVQDGPGCAAQRVHLLGWRQRDAGSAADCGDPRLVEPRLAGKGHRHFSRHRELCAQPGIADTDAAVGGGGLQPGCGRSAQGAGRGCGCGRGHPAGAAGAPPVARLRHRRRRISAGGQRRRGDTHGR